MRNRSQGYIFLRRQNIPIFLFQIDDGILVEKKGSQKNSHERQANGDMKNISVQHLEKMLKDFFGNLKRSWNLIEHKMEDDRQERCDDDRAGGGAEEQL